MARWLARWIVLIAALMALGLIAAGCSSLGSLGYYAQSVGGHLSMLNRARPVPQWIDDAAVAPDLKQRLVLSQRIRDFAVSELALPDNASYRRYADLQRSAVVWNVVAAPELSLTLRTWCFPVVGCIGYRGYFDRAEADRQAEPLRAEGLEVSVYGVPAYSTLGKLPGAYFSDPLLNTFIHYPEGELARLIFHELAHQVAYAPSDTVFNESFATAVERIGSERWLAQRASPEARAAYRVYDARRSDFRALTTRYRERLHTVYRGHASDADKRAAKASLMAQLRTEYEQMKTERWGGFSGYDGWFARANNAAFGVLAVYNERVPQFERLFELQGRDFGRFYAEVKRLAAMPQPSNALLAALPAL